MDPPVRKEVNLNPPYGEGRRELMARAIAAEAKRDTALEKYHHYEVASAAFQIGIVLASATVITGMVVLAYLAAGLGLLGLAFMAIGFFAPHAVHCSEPGASELSAQQPAIHVQRLAGDEGRVVAGEERDGADQIGRHLHARDRLPGRGHGE